MYSKRITYWVGKAAALPLAWTRPFAPAGSFGRNDASPRFTLIDHLFIIRALILRNLKLRHQKTRMGFLTEFIVPIGIMAMHYYAFTLMGRFMPAGIHVELFVLGGFTTWFTLSHAARGSMLSRKSRFPNLIAGVTQMHSLIAAAVWEVTAFTSLCFISLFLLALFGRDEPLPNVMLSAAVYAVAGLVGFGMRLILDALGEVFSLVASLRVAIFWLTFLTSGVYFSASRIDGALAPFALYNPALHLLEYQRHALFPGYPVAMVSMLYPITCGLVLTLIGLILTRWVERWLQE